MQREWIGVYNERGKLRVIQLAEIEAFTVEGRDILRVEVFLGSGLKLVLSPSESKYFVQYFEKEGGLHYVRQEVEQTVEVKASKVS